MEFIKKSSDELKGMEAVELQAYYTAKFNHEKSELEARVKSLEDEKGTAKYEALSEEVKSLKESKIESLENALKMQGIVIEKMKQADWCKLYPNIATPRLGQWKIYKYLREQIPQLV